MKTKSEEEKPTSGPHAVIQSRKKNPCIDCRHRNRGVNQVVFGTLVVDAHIIKMRQNPFHRQHLHGSLITEP